MISPRATSAVIVSRQAHPAEWDRLVEASDEATVFHTRAWSEVTAATPNPAFAGRRGRAGAWYVRFCDGAEAIVPSVAYRFVRHCLAYRQTGPGATYGGWIGSEGFGPEHERAAWKVLPWANFEARSNPLRPPTRPHPARRVPTTYPDVTYVLDLLPGYPAIEAEWRRRKAQVWINARRGEKNGIRVIRAETETQWRDFYAVYVENSRRWTAPLLHPLDALLALRERLRDRADLWLGLDGERIVAGEIAFVHRLHMAGLIRAALPEGYKKNAPALLDVCAVRHYCGQGLRWFDMDASADNEGAIRHKTSFGALSLDVSLEVYRSPGYALLRRLSGRARGAGPAHATTASSDSPTAHELPQEHTTGAPENNPCIS